MLYDREKALRYALRYALSPNPDYYFFGGIGGDCTNFISQCVYAGSGVMNYERYGWYYISSYDRAPSWTSVNYFREFLLNNKTKGPVAEIKPLQNLQIGDVIQLKKNGLFFHTLFISKITPNEIYVCAHTDNSLNRALSSYYYDETLGLHIKNVLD